MISKSTDSNRAPDCVTEVRKGNIVLMVSGYFKQNATETALIRWKKSLRKKNQGRYYRQNRQVDYHSIFSETSTETFEDKVKRMLREEIRRMEK